MKTPTLTENLLPSLTLMSCHRKLLCMCLLSKIPALLPQRKQSQAYHLRTWEKMAFSSFSIPTFSLDVELKLREGNAEFEKNNKYLQLTRDVKHDILEKLASVMYGYKAYPSDKEIAMVAEALVVKYPCLKEAGSETGWNGWKNSLKFKNGEL